MKESELNELNADQENETETPEVEEGEEGEEGEEKKKEKKPSLLKQAQSGVAISFARDLAEVSVTIPDEDDTECEYFIRELSGKRHTDFTNAMSKNSKFDHAGNFTGFITMDGVTAALLTRTIFDSEGKAVSAKWVDVLPFSTVQKLYDMSQELSGLDLDAAEAAKKD